MDLVISILGTLLIGEPITWWLTSPRLRTRRSLRRLQRTNPTLALLGTAVLQAHPVRMLPAPRPPVVLPRDGDGRTCVVGAGERATVSAAPAPITPPRRSDAGW